MTNKELDYSRFADYVIKKWLKKCEDLKVYESGALVRSFIAEVFRNAAGNVERIQFTFNYYGRMVDMGVGKGITLDDVGAGYRVAKKWYSSVLYSEVNKLAELMASNIVLKVRESIIIPLNNT